jgi:hypothetical protein
VQWLLFPLCPLSVVVHGRPPQKAFGQNHFCQLRVFGENPLQGFEAGPGEINILWFVGGWS